MENKNVKITMRTLTHMTGDSDLMELITDGVYSRVEKDGRECYCISYEDSEATGFDGATTIISAFGQDHVNMLRLGAGSDETSLMIEMGRKHHCHYSTPFGSMLMGIYTKRIINRLTDEGGELYLNYTVDMNSVFISENEIYIEVAPRVQNDSPA